MDKKFILLWDSGTPLFSGGASKEDPIFSEKDAKARIASMGEDGIRRTRILEVTERKAVPVNTVEFK